MQANIPSYVKRFNNTYFINGASLIILVGKHLVAAIDLQL